jgi:hypothetical protein
MKLTVLILLGIVSSLAFAKSSVVDLKDQILIPLKSCPERVWPAYSPLKDAEFVFTVPSEDTSYLIKMDGTMIQVRLQEWGEEGLSPYTFIEKSGKKFIVINVDEYESDNALLETAYHEAFHYLGQENLTPEILVEREEIMPMNLHSNSARTMQIRNLKAYLSDKNEEHLQKASYWEKIIKRDYLEDWKSNQHWDIAEGSAEFVGNYSLALSKLGCSATENELLNFVLDYSEKLPDISGKLTQSYKAGQYAYMVARINKMDEVFHSVSKSPVTKVLNQYDTLEEALDLSLFREFEENFGYVNSVVETTKQQISSAEAFLAIPLDSAAGAIQGMGFYKILINTEPIMIFPEARIRFSNARGSIELLEKNIILQINPIEICGKHDGYYLIPVSNSDEINSNDGISGNSFRFKEDGSFLNKKLMCII